MLLTAELNGIRARVAARLGVELTPLPVPAYESGLHGGRDRDPGWPAIFEQAWYEICIEEIGRPLDSIADYAAQGVVVPAVLLILAEDRANAMMAIEEAKASGMQRAA
jgi:hypothetical protein